MNKVVHLFFPGPFGGAEKVIIKGLSDLKEKTPLSLWIFKESRCPQFAEYFENECKQVGIDTKSFNSHGVFDFNLLKQLKNILTTDTIVHAHGMKASFYAAFLPGKLVITHHGHTSHTLKVRLYEFVQELIMKRADAVIAVSQAMQNDLTKKKIKNDLIENMLSINPVERKTIEDNNTHFVFIGRLSPEKGADVLITAFKNIRDVSLNIIGDGIQKNELERRIKDEKITNIKFLGFHSEVSSFIQEADALIMPSLREGLPMTLLEAICSGLPVIGSDVGGLKDLIKNNGILTPPGDPVALNQAIRIFIDKKETFSQNAKQKKELFIKRFSVENWSNKTQQIYTRLFSQS